jgi:hypothetical protein
MTEASGDTTNIVFKNTKINASIPASEFTYSLIFSGSFCKTISLRMQNLFLTTEKTVENLIFFFS